MPSREIAQYLGRRCQVMVSCPACGETHVHEGTLNAARLPGEVQLNGHAYPLAEIRALIASPNADAPSAWRISDRALTALLQAATLLMCASAVHGLRR